MNHLRLTVMLVLVLAISHPTIAQPKPVTLSHSTKEVMPAANNNNTTVTPERPGQSRRDTARVPILSQSQKQALVEAWQAGYHYSIPYTFAAVAIRQ